MQVSIFFLPSIGSRAEIEQGRREPMTPREMMDRGLLLVGTPGTVSRQMERLLADTPVRWLFAWTHNGLVPHDKIMRSLELFSTKVIPRFGDGA